MVIKRLYWIKYHLDVTSKQIQRVLFFCRFGTLGFDPLQIPNPWEDPQRTSLHDWKHFLVTSGFLRLEWPCTASMGSEHLRKPLEATSSHIRRSIYRFHYAWFSAMPRANLYDPGLSILLFFVHGNSQRRPPVSWQYLCFCHSSHREAPPPHNH